MTITREERGLLLVEAEELRITIRDLRERLRQYSPLFKRLDVMLSLYPDKIVFANTPGSPAKIPPGLKGETPFDSQSYPSVEELQRQVEELRQALTREDEIRRRLQGA